MNVYIFWISFYSVAPTVILIILIFKCANSLKILKCLLAILLALVFTVVGGEINAHIRHENTMRDMHARIPQAIEIFEQRREQLDLLANGEFAANSGHVFRHQEYEWLFRFTAFNNRTTSIPFEDWDTIVWLPDEEREAIIDILMDEELEYDFRSISAFGPAPNISARLLGQGGAFISIVYGHTIRTTTHSHTINLGDGYVLWVSIPFAGINPMSVFFLVIIFLFIAATAIKLGLVLSKEKQAKLNPTTENKPERLK